MEKIIKKIIKINLLKLALKPITFIFVIGLILAFLVNYQLNTNKLVTINKSSLITDISSSTYSNKKIAEVKPESPKINSLPDISLIQNDTNKPTIHEFALGWYDRVDRLKGIDIIAEQGFNIVMPYTNFYAKKDYQRIEAYLNRAYAKNIKVLLELFRDNIKDNNLAEITKYIQTFKDHPAVYGWYLFDEPTVKKVRPEKLEPVYEILKRETPNKPVALLFYPEVKYPPAIPYASYWNVFDIFMGEWYPSRVGKSEFHELEVFGSSLRRAKDFAGSNSFFTVLQAFGKDDTTINRKSQWRYPTYKEQRYMIYNGILAGTKGLFFYAYHRASNTWKNEILMPLVKELKVYLPAITNGLETDKVKTYSSIIDTGFYLYPNQRDFLIVAVNQKKRRLKTTFYLPKVINTSILEDTTKRKQIYVLDNQFKDNFEPHEVHIYRGKI